MNPNLGLGLRSELLSCFVCRYSPCSHTGQTQEIRFQGTDSNLGSFADTLVFSLCLLRYPTEDETMRVVFIPCRVLIRCQSRKENN